MKKAARRPNQVRSGVSTVHPESLAETLAALDAQNAVETLESAIGIEEDGDGSGDGFCAQSVNFCKERCRPSDGFSALRAAGFFVSIVVTTFLEKDP